VKFVDSRACTGTFVTRFNRLPLLALRLEVLLVLRLEVLLVLRR
jgi:hypothetical protein